MTKITLELDVERLRSEYDDEVGYIGSETIEEAIVNAAAALLAKRVENDFDNKVNSEITKAVQESIRAALEGKIDGIIDEPLQLFNEYGRPTGETTTLRERILEMATKIFKENVDDRGNVSSYGRGTPRWQYHVNKAVQEAIDYQLKEEIKTAIKEAKDKAIRNMGAVIADLLTKAK